MSERDVDKKLDELLDEAIPIYEKGKNEEKIEEISFSKEHEAKMEKMFERIKRKEDFLDMAKVVTKVAAVLVVAFVLLGTFEPSNSAWKKRITEFFVKDEGTGYSWVIYGDSGDSYELNFDTQKKTNRKYKITFFDYLPSGYTLNIKSNNNINKYFQLKSDTKIISAKISKDTNMKALDTENTESEKITIDGINVNYYFKDDMSSYTWFKDDYLFRFYGKNVEDDEMTKIIENINYDEIDKIFEKK